MGGGRWDSVSYRSSVTASVNAATSSGVSYDKVAFGYSQTDQARTKVHPNLDPRRINNKPFGKLESRDNLEHPNSTAVLVCFDVTGSNFQNAVVAQQKLGNLMDMIAKYMPDPQIAVAANDDYDFERSRCVQISDFESDNRVDEHTRNINLVRNGGTNSYESYDLVIYAAAYKTILDCAIKRRRKGYLFLYADEPLKGYVTPGEVAFVYGDRIAQDISTEVLISEARKTFNVYLISTLTPSWNADQQYPKLFGEYAVLTLQNPNNICELISSVIGMREANLSPDDAVRDLVAAGTPKTVAESIVFGNGRKIKKQVA